MTKRIRIDGKVYNREGLVFLEGGRVERKDYLERMGNRNFEDTGLSLNEREDGSLMPWEDVPDGLTRNEENAKMDPKFLKVVNEVKAAARDLETLAETLRMAGAQGATNAEQFARAAAQNTRGFADRILNAGGSVYGITLAPLFGEGNPGGDILETRIKG